MTFAELADMLNKKSKEQIAHATRQRNRINRRKTKKTSELQELRS